MAAQSIRITHVKLSPRKPAITLKDLALMLEIDLALGRRTDYRRRLQTALNDAARQGIARGKVRRIA